MNVKILIGDCRDVLRRLPDASVQCCVTSPPYFNLRDYGVAGQIGLEPTPDDFVAEMVAVFREVRRVLRDDGVLFLNLGDSYFGSNQTGGTKSKEGSAKRAGRMFSKPVGAQRAIACDTSGTKPEGFQASGCLCGSLCDACRAAYRLGISHNGNLLAPTPAPSIGVSTHEHMVLPPGHLPTLGLTGRGDHSEAAILDPEQASRLAGEPPRDAPVSMTHGSSRRPQAEPPRSGQPSGCLSCGRSLPDCVPASARMGGCTCGTSAPGSASDSLGKGASGLAYPHLTTKALKPKDLIGIPWRVAFALQQPFYAGTIKNEMDRVWLAAMLDGEGCFYIHRRQAGQHAGEGYYRQTDNYSCAFEVANTSEAIVQRCLDLTGVGSIIRQDKDRRQPLFRWTVRSNEAKALIREIYPYLVAKKQQARIVFGITSSGKDAESGWAAMKILHSGGLTDVDYSAPPSCHEPGWYLRSSIIWAKPNPMPESVRDRPTSAHENIFLLAKSDRYFFDADAVKEQAIEYARTPNRPRVDTGIRKGASDARIDAVNQCGVNELRNIRNVWTVATQPFSDAHFATFPPALIEPCIKAGCPAGGTVLDPFGGAGTTGLVADRLQRHAVLIELNPDYAAMAERRIACEAGIFGSVDVETAA